MVPSGRRIWKKPWPSMTMSSGLSVCLNVPWVKIFWVATGRTPWPICMPMGSCAPCVDGVPANRSVWYNKSWKSTRLRLKPVGLTLARLLEIVSMLNCWADVRDAAGHSDPVRAAPLRFVPAKRSVWYNKSWKSTRLRLKPVVLTLARLLEIVSMLNCWADMPDAAVHSDRIIALPLRFLPVHLHPPQLVDRLAQRLVIGLDHPLVGLVRPVGRDELHHGGNHVDVGHFQVTRVYPGGRRLRCPRPIGRSPKAASFADEPLGIGEIPQGQHSRRRAVHPDLAVLGHLHVPT